MQMIRSALECKQTAKKDTGVIIGMQPGLCNAGERIPSIGVNEL